MDFHLKLLIKLNPVAFLLIAKGYLVCTFKSSVGEILVSCYLFYSLKGRSCLKCIRCFARFGTFCTMKTVKNTHGGMSLLVKLHAYITHGNIRSNANSDLSIVTMFWSLVESIGVIKKMTEILLTANAMVFLCYYISMHY